MLIIAVSWYLEKKEKEPLIVFLGQIVTLLALSFEKQASGVFTRDINNSEVKIKNRNNDRIHTEKVKDSKIDIS